MAVAWSLHPDLIPAEVGCVIPKPELPFIKREPLLFLSASEIIHSKKDTLQLQAFIQIVEIHDFTPLESSDDDSSGDRSDSKADGISGHGYVSGSLHPCPKVYRCVGNHHPGNPDCLFLRQR
jgi:hypothetical protein